MMRNLFRIVTGTVLLAGFLFVSPAQAAPRFYVRIGPPAPVVETRPPVRRGYAWHPGYHRWVRSRYEWVPGRWVRPPARNARWVPGRWAHDRRGYYWVGGRWAR